MTHTASMDYELRPCTQEELADLIETLRGAFSSGPKDEDTERMSRVLDPERTLGVFDDKTMVATAGAFSFVLTIPGGEIPAAGVSVVGVLPSHRRRGLLRSMMRRQLDDIRDRKEPVAILWASESAIYQRFGYGLASQHASFDIDRDRARFRREQRQNASARLVSREEALDVLPSIYERVRVLTPGMFARDETWWDAHRLFDGEHHRDGAGPMFRVVVDVDSRTEAYALYRVHSSWDDDGLHHGTLDVIEAIATTTDALQALWEYLFGVDLVERVKGFSAPVDFPLKFMLEDMRRLRLRVHDALWLRVVDVTSALEVRTYARPGGIVFELTDDFCPWNEGRWSLEVSSTGPRVQPSTGDPDLRMTVEELGALYLGGTTFAELQRAARVEELTDGAVARADELFTTDRVPWCPEIF